MGKITRRKCDNKSCKNNSKEIKSDFCPDCGVKVTIDEIDVKTKVNPIDMFDEGEMDEIYDEFIVPHAGDEVIDKNFTWLLPNTHKLDEYSLDIEDDMIGELDTSHIDKSEAIDAFFDLYKMYLEKFDKMGVESEVKFGLFVHYS